MWNFQREADSRRRLLFRGKNVRDRPWSMINWDRPWPRKRYITSTTKWERKKKIGSQKKEMQVKTNSFVRSWENNRRIEILPHLLGPRLIFFRFHKNRSQSTSLSFSTKESNYGILKKKKKPSRLALSY